MSDGEPARIGVDAAAAAAAERDMVPAQSRKALDGAGGDGAVDGTAADGAAGDGGGAAQVVTPPAARMPLDARVPTSVLDRAADRPAHADGPGHGSGSGRADGAGLRGAQRWRTPVTWKVLLGAARVVVWPVARLRVTGALPQRLRGGPVILAVNHIGPFDPVAVTAACRVARVAPRLMATGGLFKAPVVGAVMRASGHIRINRRQANVADAVDDVTRALAVGSHVLGYPEGRITLDPGMWPERGKTGLARVALATGGAGRRGRAVGGARGRGVGRVRADGAGAGPGAGAPAGGAGPLRPGRRPRRDRAGGAGCGAAGHRPDHRCDHRGTAGVAGRRAAAAPVHRPGPAVERAAAPPAQRTVTIRRPGST
ncbi:hypothetical protein GCM10020218_086560 [Dactylosporangium vinaceum]